MYATVCVGYMWSTAALLVSCGAWLLALILGASDLCWYWFARWGGVVAVDHVHR